jgi:alcohol dehydrogenase (cytochrome c)
VAPDADTGKLKWHFQFTPHDLHDWDAIADPVLVDLKVQGQAREGRHTGESQRLFYALDRATGKRACHSQLYQGYLGRRHRRRWAAQPDRRPGSHRGRDQVVPGMGGGHNWQATAYSPRSGLYYFTSTDGCQIYFKTKQEFIEGQWYQGSTNAGLPTDPATGSILAVNPVTGETKWRIPTVSPPSGGLLATAGGLLFAGDREGYFNGA